MRAVTARAFVLGLLCAAALAGINCWIETVANVHFLGGVQMPFGAIFGLLFMVIAINIPLRDLNRSRTAQRRLLLPFSAVELLTVYSMMLMAALVSTPGADNFFITVGPTLFYFSTRENGWAGLFYRHVPSWFAPGWDGTTFQREVIDPLYLGHLPLSQIPWHAWTAMLIAWSIFLLLIYSTLIFVSLLFRRQWIEHEALSFPLIQLPLQMVDTDAGSTHPPARAFWGNRTLWMGVGLACAVHFLRGMNNYFPDWPVVGAFQGQAVALIFTDQPWNALGSLQIEIFFGAIGMAFLLTREVSLSFWVFSLLNGCQLVLAQQLGFAPGTLPHDAYLGRPTFITYQSIGGWIMTAALLVWSARGHLSSMTREALSTNRAPAGEPFSPRFMMGGLALSLLGLLAWSWFAGINLFIALVFFAIFLMASLVLARLVIEGGYLFPQSTFSAIDLMTTGLLGTHAVGAADLTKLSFIQPSVLSDMRTNVLPAFLHTLKIAHEMKLGRRDVHRLMASVCCAIVVALAVTVFVSIVSLYSVGGLAGYSWFTKDGGQLFFNGAANTIRTSPGVQTSNVVFLIAGAALTLGLTVARSQFLWFPLHPLGYIVASGYPMTRLWFSFFVGWLVKTLVLRFGGTDTIEKVRPFMIGLILGNVVAMVLWMLAGFWLGSQIQYWPA